jgi:hypothetical protein
VGMSKCDIKVMWSGASCKAVAEYSSAVRVHQAALLMFSHCKMSTRGAEAMERQHHRGASPRILSCLLARFRQYMRVVGII